MIFANLDQHQYWHQVGPMLGKMLVDGKYSIHHQHEYLSLFAHLIIPRLGPFPSPGRDIYMCLLGGIGSIELSRNFQRLGSTARLAFEPTSYLASTDADPFNRHAVHATLAELRMTGSATVDLELHHTLAADLTLTDRDEQLLTAELAKTNWKTQILLALDLTKTGITVKEYFYPVIKAAATGRSVAELCFSAIRKVDVQGRLAAPCKAIEAHMQRQTQTDLHFLSVDLVDPGTTRFKLYLMELEVTLAKVEEHWTLGGTLTDEETMRGLQMIRELWVDLGIVDGKRAEPQRPSLPGDPLSIVPFFMNYEMTPGQPLPKPKFYFPLIGIPELKIANVLAAFFERHGMHDLATAYSETLQSYYPGEDLAIATDRQAWLSVSYTEEKGPYLTIGFLRYLHKEESIRALFAEVLARPEKDVSAHDGFYDLGGNSLAAIELVARARDRGLEITVADVIRLQTVQQIAGCAVANRDVHTIAAFALLEDVEQSLSTAAAQCRVRRDMIEDMYACTPLQAGLVYLSIKNPGSFVSTYRFSFTPSVDLDRFQGAWKRTYLAHPMLRTCVVQLQDGQLLQVVIKAKALSTSSYATDNAETMALGRPLTRWEVRHARGSKPAVFTLTMHHAVFDGWSFIQVLDDLQNVYDGHALPSRPSFNRVIDYISRLDMSAAYRFWSQEFTGLRATVFPDSCNRSSVVSPRPSSRSHRIPLATADKDWTLANKIKLAWALVVSAQTCSNDVVYGLTVSGRNAPVPGIDCIAGPTIATFPFRTQLDPHSSVEDMLLRLREHDVAIIPFEHTGLARISEASPEAALACRFQNLLTIRLSSVQSPSAILTNLPENEHQELLFASYPLSLVAQQRAESLEIKAFFDSTVLDTNRVQMLLDEFATALQRILRDPGTQMGQLMTQNPPDWHQLAVWNRKDNPERLRCMHEVIMDFCLTQPDAEAVSAWDGSLKYLELLSLSRGVAGHLQSRGCCRGTVIGICMERSKWFPVAILGVLMSGAAMVLLEPNFPIPRLQQIVQDADARVVICSPALQDKCRKIVDSTVTLTSDIVLADYCSWSPSSVTPQDPMYVAFTSGSTGTPKGVVIEHGMVYSVVHGHKDVISVSNTSRGLLFASPAFDICLAEVMFMLAAGGCVCIPSEDQRMNKLAGAMTDMRVNIAMLTPSVARTISPAEVPCLQTLVLGGEAPSVTDLATWASQVRLHQSYGPAECTMYTTTTGPLSPASDPSNVGSCPNASCWIVNPDNHHQLQPVGSVGELLIGGPIVGRGYKKRTAETEAAFIRNPSWCVKFPFLQGHRFYKTGDLAVFRPDGSLSLVGRKDAQIELHGQRIELHEIEHCAEQYEQQTAAIAGLVTPREIAEPRLVLFVYNPKQVDTTSGHFPNHVRQELFVPPSSEILSRLQGLKMHLSQHLPSFMVPSLLIPLSRLPLSPSGKADRKKMREEAGNLTREIVTEYLGHAASHKRQPITEQERFVRANFAKVLSLDEESIGVDDDFFALEGDSISAIQLLTLCRKGNLALSMLDFLSYNTVSLFCEHACSTYGESVALLKKQSHEASAPRDTTSKADGPLVEFPEAEMQLIQSLLNVANINDIEDVYSCSDAHAGVLELYTPNYSSTAIFEIRTRKAVTLSQVVAAWNGLVQHHAALRTIVLHVPNLHVGYLHVVLRRVSADVVILPRSQNVRQEVEKLEPVWSWEATPPHRLVVGQEDDGTVLLRLDTGRALIDAISMAILLEGFCLALRGSFSASKETPYRQYLTYLRGQSREEALQFWKQTLSETRPCNLPRVPSELHPPCRSRPCKARPLRRSLRVEQFNRLTSFWRSNHVTLTNIFQLAWALTLQHYTKSRDVCFGTVISGRDIPLPAIWQMVGTFFNVVPCRFILEPASTVLDTLRQNQEEMQRRNEHQHCSMPAAVRQAGIVGVAGLQQLFNTVLAVQNVFGVGSSRDKGNGDEIVMKLVELEDATEYDFCVAVLLSPSQIDVELRYWASSASEDYASRILKCFLHHLEEILHHVSEPLSAIAGFE
ncbi:uncharacterized protein P174DRAFT_449186 [Aspergillus novofumigatus IBT 16806]|uniref:Carrier domain-containing protein n=1 Tax=Aspergillus novofumigatus (strain IBT 16806) TaxID=1392255 RepID=A0A2I1CIX5_ASPN1|nr:uncharacterized protein P174DRAFT_449186 [Aspergillus novofumigatus IBT 16806]PKX97582.1 hypothetical protein P174DRAFT_449186 [Aspergillus novofumigatus IBT 16806]